MSWTRLCQCCQTIVGRPPTLAVYLWTHQHGGVTPLCVSCCATWRRNTQDDPSLLPRRIEVVVAA